MKVGYIFNHSTVIGGGELSQLDLTDAIRDCGVVPVGIVPAQGEITEWLANKKIAVHIMEWPALNLAGCLRFPGVIKSVKVKFKALGVDLIHVNGARCMLYAGPAARSLKIPCVWHVRVLNRDFILDRIRAYYADAIIANSRAVANTLKSYIPLRRNIEVIYNGFRLPELLAASPVNLQKEFGLPAGPVILAVGRFSPGKGFDDLIRACGLLQRGGTSFSCLLVGKALGVESNRELELKKLAAQAAPGNIYFPGWRRDIPALMKAAAILAAPSREESFGRTIPEAWACGLPVVAARTGGPAEIITHGETGLLVEPGDVPALAGAIEKLISDEALRDRLAVNGAARAKDFSLDRHAKNIFALYQELARA